MRIARKLVPVLLLALLAAACPAKAPPAPAPSTPSATQSPASPEPSPEAPVKVDVSYKPHTKVEHYTVHGATPSEIYAQIQSQGPGRFAGEAGWQMSYDTLGDYGVDGPCRLNRVVVDLEVTLTLPRWRPPAGVSSATRSYWRSVSATLERHERGHERLAQQYARRLIHDLLGVRSAVSCGKLYRRADDRADRVFATLNRANRRYDAVTDHGLNQSAA